MRADPRPRHELLLLLAVFALAGLYLAAIGPYWNITPDSAGYLGNARALAAGQGWRWGPHPPVTSLAFAPVVVLFPGRYAPLNAVTTVLYLLALVLAYRLIAPRAGRLHGLVVVLLSLGFVRAFDESTELLSEPLYACLSFLFLVLVEGAPRRGRRLVAGAVLVLVGLTRTVGLTLILAVLLYELGGWLVGEPGERRATRGWRIGMALLAGLAVLGWKAWVGEHQAPVWEAYTPPRDSIGLLDRILANVPSMIAVGAVLVNHWDLAGGPRDLLVHSAGSLLVLAGLIGALRERPSMAAFYLSIYLLVVTAQAVLASGLAWFRFLVPVAPLVFHYALLGARAAYRQLTVAFGRHVARALPAAGALYVVWYLGVGVPEIVERTRDEHRSLFGDYPIKRAGAVDAQRLALWLRDHAEPGERFAALQSGMWQVVSERDGVDLVTAHAGQPGPLLEWLRWKQIHYVLLDRNLPISKRIVLPAEAAFPERFQLLIELPTASLYRLR